MEKRIIGSVGVGDQTFGPGEEEEMEAAVEAATAAKKANVNWDKLEAKGVVQGYGKAPKAESEGEGEEATTTKGAAKKKSRRGR